MPDRDDGLVVQVHRLLAKSGDLLVQAPVQGMDPTGIGVDSRAIQRGMLYLALRGSQADGHRFVGDEKHPRDSLVSGQREPCGCRCCS